MDRLSPTTPGKNILLKIAPLLLLALTTSCTYKCINNHYIIQSRGSAFISAPGQSVTGSDAQDSLNGNKAAVDLGM